MSYSKKITGGVYLVLDPSMELDLLLKQLRQALDGGIQLLQVWNNWPESFDREKKKDFIETVSKAVKDYQIPLLINEEWELLKDSSLSGVHFDHIPPNFIAIKATLNKYTIIGITCGNDLKVVEWAEKNQLDYISFCALFPSSSVGSCEIIKPETLLAAKKITSLPLFVSGGITPENMNLLKDLKISGVAVISGILNNDSPKQATLDYSNALNALTS